jgi:hypothetical protein
MRSLTGGGLNLAGANNEVAVTTGERNKRQVNTDVVNERVLNEHALGDANVGQTSI